MNQEIMAPVQIPLDVLSAEALTGIIDNYVQREGTDYGAVELRYETKIEQIRQLLKKGEALVIFDPNTESVQILDKVSFQKLSRAARDSNLNA